MTSKIRVLDTGVWKGPLGDGVVKVKKSGAWQSPATIKVKADGAWVDTGYIGEPNPPIGLKVKAWDYDSLQVTWSPAAAGGAAIDYYTVQLLNASGGVISAENSTDTVGPSWTVANDTKYQSQVRSHSPNGLVSDWTPMLQVGIGHPVSYDYGNVSRTRDWESNVLSGAYNANAPIWIAFGSTIVLKGMHWRTLYTPMSSVVTPFGNRTVNWLLNGGDYGQIDTNLGQVNSGDNTDYAFNNPGTGQPWGIVARGAGWSTTGNSTYQLHVGSFWLAGIETYNSYEIISTNPAKANYYW